MDDIDFSSAIVVYNAAREGNVMRLKGFLEPLTKSERTLLVAAETNGATPLVMACRNGHCDVAEYLIMHCKADIEQVGAVVFDGETIEGAPPLWCAAAAGHIAVVRMLVRLGANVNSTTKTNSTPLRAACFDGHFDIVKYLVNQGADIEVANRHGHTCLMIACYKGHLEIANYLLSLNADVNRKSVKGNTALHDCAESGSLCILKLLLQHGAKMDVDSYGMTPLLAASVTGHTHIVEYLINQQDFITRKERVDALELLGATFVDKRRDMIGALNLWKRAMEVRFLEGLVELPKPAQINFIPAYDYVREVRDPESLDDLLADPDEMRMQALAIRERILGPAHPDTSYYIRFRGAVYADAGKFSRCIALWNYALDMQQAMLEPLNTMTQSSLFSFTELFSFMMGDHCRMSSRGRIVPPVLFSDLITVFNKAVMEVESGLSSASKMVDRDSILLHRVIVLSLHLACLLTKLMPNLSANEIFELRKAVYRLVKSGATGDNKSSLLHLVCSRETSLIERYQSCQFPSPLLAALLISVGADVEALDNDGNTSLHVAARNGCSPALVTALLDGGSHIDRINASGATFADLLRNEPIHKLVNPIRYTTLACLAAKIVVKHKIPYWGIIPQTLYKFVDQH